MLDVSLFCLLLSVTTAHVVTPEQFGAVGDGKANDWAAIQKTMAACTNQTYCRIDFVNTYLTGPVVVSTSNTTLNITGNVFMLPKSTYDYPSGGSFMSNSGPIENIHVTGGGTIGNHETLFTTWWLCKLTGCFRPHLIKFTGVTGLRIDNLHLRNPANHFIELESCTNVRVDKMDIKAPNESPNSDGINFYGGHDQSFTNSVVHNGDDCVSVVPIGEFTDPCINGDPAQNACRGGNVVVHNVRCEGGHGIAIGGVRHGTVSNVTFSNMTATGGFGNTQGLYSPGGLRIKSYPKYVVPFF
jgi:polygalacturonase